MLVGVSVPVLATDTNTSAPLIQPVKALQIRQPTTLAPFAADIEASEHVQIAFRIAGQLQQVWVRMGDDVLEGQLLAELDPTDYQLALQARQAEFDLAVIRAKRDQKLYSQNLISEDQFDRSKTAQLTAQARLRQAKVDLDDTVLRAPFDGYVSYTMAKQGEVMPANQAIMTVENNSHIDVHFNLPVPHAHYGQEAGLTEASIRFGGMQQIYKASAVKEYSSTPDPDTNSYRVTLTLDKPEDINPLTGMNAWVEVGQSAGLNEVHLPTSALFNRTGNKAKVWKINSDNRITAVDIEVDEHGKLLAGLKHGDRVVATGVDKLKSQQLVRIWERERGI
ncbi:efflux RND transporter periplasmic adaptor subunit [Ferrimonas lipolytica]|uniref:Efflux RND transporter periplasmic adaptor subunit n=1 Tax=Ferrimonas lipolytica TaxID=2724191 RepID=A0A6H1UEX0_9GAMM|nr:efflux RND transporter periplasmic adaptor subunit [Ferrimonas lipolytica]QIZ76342.1 efflux RND transporter periplasmic adaptor subunit [Ferrimonas lipolytica]